MGTITSILKLALPGWLVLLELSGSAFAWWNDEWTVRKKITLDTSSIGSTISDPIGTAALLIRLHDGNFQFASAKDDGGDLRFVAEDDKTPLAFHIEKYDSLLNEAFVWVKLPDLKPGTRTSFWLYYGNSSGKAVRADDPKATYDDSTVLVYHFAGKGQPPVDDTKFGNTAQNAGTTDEGSLIGSGLRLDGQGTITIPASPSLASDVVLTWSAWIKLDVLQPDATIFSRRDSANGFSIGVDRGVPFVEVTRATGTQRSPPGAAIAPNIWRHLAMVAEDQRITLFLDGEQYAVLNVPLPALNTAASIGRPPADVSPRGTGLNGELDELELSKVARPAGFIKLAALSQAGDKAPKLLTLGEDERKAGFVSGYFAVILKSVTPDGWVVIGVLMVMALLTWIVMANRLGYLNGAVKGNTRFLREWNGLDWVTLDLGNMEDLKSLGGRLNAAHQRVVRRAPLYRLYHVGVDEIQRRLAANPEIETRGLSAQSIQAIRASLDAGQVRETQKLSRLIVFLTLSISGGPFLGLLGTVIGVMITFAAIAAQGDVNVNAIAPGIAAALVATVAGLSVAIPALFSYNYLISRIKDATK
jgi:biopolymer transport protein ExbB